MIYILTVVGSFIILKLFFGFKVLGAQNIPSKGAFILASNHSSYLDPLILGGTCYCCRGRKLNYLAKGELFHGKIFGWYLRNLRAFPVRRQVGDIRAIRESIRKIRSGEPLVIFPEGGRSTGGDLREGSPGIALLATKTNIPVIPAYIKGSDSALGVGSKSIKFNKISLNFGKPLILYKEGPQTYSDITNRIMAAIKELSTTC